MPRTDHRVSVEKHGRTSRKVELAGELQRFAQAIPRVVFRTHDRRIGWTADHLRERRCRSEQQDSNNKGPHREPPAVERSNRVPKRELPTPKRQLPNLQENPMRDSELDVGSWKLNRRSCQLTVEHDS